MGESINYKNYWNTTHGLKDLVGFWPFNKKYGGRDLAQSENSAQFFGDIGFTANQAGVEDGAVKLKSNATTYIEISNTNQELKLEADSSFSLFAWVYNSASIGPLIAYNGNTASFHSRIWWWPNTRTIVFGSSTKHARVDSNLFDRHWVHIGLVFDFSNAKVHFIIGTQVVQSFQANDFGLDKFTDSSIIRIGAQSGYPYYLNINIYCLRIFKNALVTRKSVTDAQNLCEYFHISDVSFINAEEPCLNYGSRPLIYDLDQSTCDSFDNNDSFLIRIRMPKLLNYLPSTNSRLLIHGSAPQQIKIRTKEVRHGNAFLTPCLKENNTTSGLIASFRCSYDPKHLIIYITNLGGNLNLCEVQIMHSV